MGSLPVSWIAVGCLLLILLLIVSVLLVLKSREVAALKKQCEELSETMRLMRYEETNLSRMLHKASEPVLPLNDRLLQTMAEDTPAETEEEVPEGEETNSSEVQETEVAEVDFGSYGRRTPSQTNVPTDDCTTDDCTAEQPADGLSSALLSEAETPALQHSLEENPAEPIENPTEAIEHSTEEETIERPAETPAEELAVAPVRKQPINERRPAIPTDLFAAWFAENEDSLEEDTNSSELQTILPTEDCATEKPADTLLSDDPSAVPETPAVEPIETAAELPSAVLPEEHTDTETMAGDDTSQEPAGNVTAVELSKEDERFCRKLERIVGARLHNPNLNIDIIAAQFGIGRTNFYRKVRELMGISPNDYLRKCRMERAAELLKGSEQPISEVCAQVGIPDAQYFSRVFKTFYGMAPSAYREQYQPNIS